LTASVEQIKKATWLTLQKNSRKYFVSSQLHHNYWLEQEGFRFRLNTKQSHIELEIKEGSGSIMSVVLDEWWPSFERTSSKRRSTFVSTLTTKTTSKSWLTSKMSRLCVDFRLRWPKYMFCRQGRLRQLSTLKIDASDVLRRQVLSRCRRCFLAKEVPLCDSSVGVIWKNVKTGFKPVS